MVSVLALSIYLCEYVCYLDRKKNIKIGVEIWLIKLHQLFQHPENKQND